MTSTSTLQRGNVGLVFLVTSVQLLGYGSVAKLLSLVAVDHYRHTFRVRRWENEQRFNTKERN